MKLSFFFFIRPLKSGKRELVALLHTFRIIVLQKVNEHKVCVEMWFYALTFMKKRERKILF